MARRWSLVVRGAAETSRPAAGMVGGGGGRRGRWQTTGLKGLGGEQGAVLEADLNAEHATWQHVPPEVAGLAPVFEYLCARQCRDQGSAGT